MKSKKSGVFTPSDREPWEHERRVAEILARAGHYVEFLAEGSLRTPDIRVDGVIEYEIKSPESARAITIERAIKKALKQSRNIIIDASRMKDARDDRVRNTLIFQARSRKQIKEMLYITKRGKIIDITSML